MLSAWKCFYSRDGSEKVSDGGSVNCKECDTNIVTGEECAIGFMRDVLSSQNSKSMFSRAYLDANGCALCLPSVTVKPFEENRNKSGQEVKNLQSKISTIEKSLEKIKKTFFATCFLC